MLSLRDLPNVLTVTRMLLVGPLVYLLLTERYTSALVLAVVSGVSDWLDGALARRFNWQSKFGGVFDPLADKTLMIAVYAALAWLGHLPAWLFWLVVLRDLVIVTGGLIYHYRIEPFRAEPTRLSKFNTLCQVLLMWAILTALAGLALPQALIHGLVWLVAFTVLATMFQYVLVWGFRAREIVRQRAPE
ncbi:MAG TPA: CDP-alcohol phosphatidyltransferase family protein [Wenzhouxiangellaceae bacterium]|nr:CDP-alcohol phosphatidyltransferase family protein [Wenzhouxiangellaceae bacterium]